MGTNFSEFISILAIFTIIAIAIIKNIVIIW